MSKTIKEFFKQQAAEEQEYLKNMKKAFEENSTKVDKIIGDSVPGGAQSIVDTLDDMLQGKSAVLSFVPDEEEEDDCS